MRISALFVSLATLGLTAASLPPVPKATTPKTSAVRPLPPCPPAAFIMINVALRQTPWIRIACQDLNRAKPLSINPPSHLPLTPSLPPSLPQWTSKSAVLAVPRGGAFVSKELFLTSSKVAFAGCELTYSDPSSLRPSVPSAPPVHLFIRNTSATHALSPSSSIFLLHIPPPYPPPHSSSSSSSSSPPSSPRRRPDAPRAQDARGHEL
jgi:hypothetical protein